MGVDIFSYRARVGLFYCIYIRTKHNLSLNDIICINIILQNDTSPLPAVLLIHVYGIGTHKNMRIVMKPSPRNVKTYPNTCIFSTQHSVLISFMFIAVMFIIYFLFKYTLWGY